MERKGIFSRDNWRLVNLLENTTQRVVMRILRLKMELLETIYKTLLRTHETQSDYWRLMRLMGTHETRGDYWRLMTLMGTYETQRDYWRVKRPMTIHETQRD